MDGVRIDTVTTYLKSCDTLRSPFRRHLYLEFPRSAFFSTEISNLERNDPSIDGIIGHCGSGRRRCAGWLRGSTQTDSGKGYILDAA